jgi:predicted transcriptional regulator of viral defense system
MHSTNLAANSRYLPEPWTESHAAYAMRTRDICGVDRRCGRAVHSLMMRLVEKGLARRFKKGVYLIERKSVEEVLTALKEWI